MSASPEQNTPDQDLNPLSLFRLARKSVIAKEETERHAYSSAFPRSNVPAALPVGQPNADTSITPENTRHDVGGSLQYEGRVSTNPCLPISNSSVHDPGLSGNPSFNAGATWTNWGQSSPFAIFDTQGTLDLNDLQNHLSWDLDDLLVDMDRAAEELEPRAFAGLGNGGG